MGHRRVLGFTLIEILIAVSIFSVIAIALYTGFNAGIRVWRRAEQNMELHQSIRFFLGGIGKELRNAINYGQAEGIGEIAGEGEAKLVVKPDLVFVGERDNISFVTLITRILEENESSVELAKINYSLNTDGTLMRKAAYQNEGFAETDINTEKLISDVEELRFEYVYKAEDEELPPTWKDYWQGQEGLPIGVKVFLKLKKQEGIAGDFFKTVFIPTGIMGEEESFSSKK